MGASITKVLPRSSLSMQWPLLLALLVAMGYGYLGTSTVLPDLSGDSATYWLTAKGWSPWYAPSTLAREFAAASTYPPLYPLLLAWTGGSATLLAAHGVTSCLLVGGILALWAFARRAGLDVLAATGVAFTYACLATTRLEGLDLHSEPLYLLLSMLALNLAIKLRAQPDYRTAAALGVLVAGALLTRSCGLMLLLAVALAGLRARHPTWLLAVLPGAMALAANALLQNSQHRYFGEFLARYAAPDLLQILLANLQSAAIAWAVAVGGAGMPYATAGVLWAFGLMVIAAAAWRCRQGHVDGIYALLYLGLITTWPYPAETVRLFMPFAGLALVQPCLAARTMPDSRKTLLLRQLWWLPLGIALGDTVGFIGRLAVPMQAELAPYRRTTEWLRPGLSEAMFGIGTLRAVDLALAELPTLVPEDACVLSIKPSVVAALGARRSMPPPPANVEPAAFDLAVTRSGCRYALLLSASSPSFPTALYPAARLAHRLRVIKQYPNTVQPGQLALALTEILPPAP